MSGLSKGTVRIILAIITLLTVVLSSGYGARYLTIRQIGEENRLIREGNRLIGEGNRLIGEENRLLGEENKLQDKNLYMNITEIENLKTLVFKLESSQGKLVDKVDGMNVVLNRIDATLIVLLEGYDGG